MISLCITGYRPSKMPTEYGYNIHNAAWTKLKKAFTDISLYLWATNRYHLTIYTGMALGVDQAFAEAAFSLRNKVPGIEIIAATPCYNQEVKWPTDSRTLYHNILAQCDKVTVVTKSTFTNACMELRNQYMVDHSDIVIAVYNGGRGGTKNCIDYAIKKSKSIIRIDPATLIVHTNLDILEAA